MTIWRSLLAWLAALSADPAAIDAEAPRAAAAVAAAYATFGDAAPAPAPTPPGPSQCPCGGRCNGTGIYRPDGRIEMRCSPGCRTCSRSVVVPECPCGGGCSPACSCGCRCPDGRCPTSPAPKR